LAHELGKLKPKAQNPGGNAYRRLQLDTGCNAIAAAADHNPDIFGKQTGRQKILHRMTANIP
jgi:hypothetical protein